jgi:hypothetical protein
MPITTFATSRPGPSRRPLRSGAVLLLAALFVSAATSASGQRFNAGAYGRDSSGSGYGIKRKIQFNTVYQGVTLGGIAGTLASLDRLQARGMKAVIWLGAFDRGVHCGFERDDQWIETVVTGLAGHPAIAAYQLGDEVNGRRTADCNDVPGLMKQRTQLIKSIDPSARTYVTLGMWGDPDYFAYEDYVGSADILGLVVYPCVHQKHDCVWAKIRHAIQAARHDHLPRYWAVVQDFGNDWYRQPTARELRRQLRIWRKSAISGYFVYHWQAGAIESKPRHLAVLERSNHYFRKKHRS